MTGTIHVPAATGASSAARKTGTFAACSLATAMKGRVRRGIHHVDTLRTSPETSVVDGRGVFTSSSVASNGFSI